MRVLARVLAVGQKVCTSCQSKLPACTDFFRKQSFRKDGLQVVCKECMRKTDARYRETLAYKESQSKYSATERGKEAGRNRLKTYRGTINGHLVNIYHHIKERCESPHHSKYEYYGGRGIVCRFRTSREFADYVINVLDIDPRGLDCDRIDNNGHYEKGNVQFITHKDNLAKRRK